MSEQGSNGKKLSSTQVILIVGIVLILAAVLGVGALVVGRLGQQSSGSEASGSAATPSFGSGAVVMDDKNVNNMVEEMKRKAEEGRYEVKMSVNWTFPDGESVSEDAYVANTDVNTHPVYFDVTLEDGTVVYTSPLIPVGSAVDGIKLDQPLDAGTYSTVCTYHLLQSEEDTTEISTVSVVVRITVKA